MRPNILFITSHDLGQHLGCYGVTTVATPALDELARTGVRFTRSFCTAPQCSPSRAAIHTGRYPHATGVLGLTHGAFAWDLHPGEQHLASVLGRAGYHTAVIGVQHESRQPARGGYAEMAVGEEPAATIAEKCGSFFRRQRGSTEPFYLQVGFFEPHRRFDFGGATPDRERGVFIPPYLKDEPATREELAGFQGAIRQLDQAMGQLLRALATHGLAENTLVIFAADHGIPFPRAKCTLYDPGLQVALLMRWPARGWSGGRTIDALVSNVDYFPTLLEAAGLTPEVSVQGTSFAPLLDGRSYRSREEIFAEMTYHLYYDPLRCIRTSHFKLIGNFGTGPSYMNATQTYRPVAAPVVPAAPEHTLHPDLELYDLQNDPNEWHNLAGRPEWRELQRDLAQRLRRWMQETGDPLLQGVPACPQHHRVIEALSCESR